jgi:hypothetical protein
VLDVPEVQLDALRPRQGGTAVDLGPAGDPGADRQPSQLALGVLRDLVRQRRARPDDRHLPAQDVDEVRQLVERRAAQELADPRDARVALVDGQAGADVLGAGDHRAQLEDVELVAVLADAPLAVDHAAARLQPDRQRREREQRRRQHERRPGQRDVERAAGHQRVPSAGSQPAGVPWRSQSHRPTATDAVVST